MKVLAFTKVHLQQPSAVRPVLNAESDRFASCGPGVGEVGEVAALVLRPAAAVVRCRGRGWWAVNGTGGVVACTSTMVDLRIIR